MEQISAKVEDDGIRNAEGKPIAGGDLFRKHLLNRCQEDFGRGWFNQEATAAAATKAKEEQALKAVNTTKEEEVALYSDEYYAAQKAKRQGLGLIKFIGELFKVHMLTERIMHECVKKFLGNAENPEEEEIESLCKLLITVGQVLDKPKARAHMNVDFDRMKELTKSTNVNSRMQVMLQDVIELRERKWQQWNTVAALTTIAKIHEAAAKEKAAAEKDAYARQMNTSMSRTGSRRGGDRNDHQVVRDLSKFGQISKGVPMTFGPSSVFAGKKVNKRESLSRTNSNANMFQMLQNVEAAEVATKTSRPPSRRPSPAPQRKRLNLLPRTKPVDQDSSKKKISEDTKEFFGVRSLDEAEVYFEKLPSMYHHSLVDKLVTLAIESKEADARLVGDFFERAAAKKLCSASAFEEGFLGIAEFLDDIAIDAPKATDFLAMMIKGADLGKEQRTNIASKSAENGDKLLELSS
ncbi:armadillo-type protein [Lentinula novae-zelandiae]|nr:armadillo-type protein [Lentinula novae-zelandiae]